MRRCDHIFAYTRQGAALAIERGIPPEKVTAVMNSVDVDDLMVAYQGLTEADVQKFLAAHALVPGKIFGYIGGIDSAKRIEFLSTVLADVWHIDPQVKIVVAGRGNQQELLRPAVDRGQVIMLGYGGPAEKALVGKVSQALVNPGRVGLVAVDCLAIGLPILTTDWDFHAPEYDYLTPGCDVFTSRNDVAAFSRLILQNASGDGRIRQHSGRPHPTLADMVHNFASGVHAMLR
jgi:glycosyltransferase involved in cell wall biosynthesis